MAPEAPAQHLVSPTTETPAQPLPPLDDQAATLVVEYFTLRDLERGLLIAREIALAVEDEVLFDDLDGLLTVCDSKARTLLATLAQDHQLHPHDPATDGEGVIIEVNGQSIALTARVRDAMPQVLRSILPNQPEEADTMPTTNQTRSDASEPKRTLGERTAEFAKTYWPHMAMFATGALIGGFVGARYYGQPVVYAAVPLAPPVVPQEPLQPALSL